MAEPPIDVLHCAWQATIGGAERAVYLLVREQAADPETVPAALYARGGLYAERVEALGCPVHVLGAGRASDLRVLPRAIRVMRRHRVHHLQGPEPLLMLASLACRGARRVYTQRAGTSAGGVAAMPRAKRWRYRIVGLMLRRGFHAYSANTAHAIDSTVDFFGVPRERVRVTHNGLQFDLLDPQRPADKVRAELGLEPGHFVLGTAATLKAWKRVERLIEVAAALRLDDLRVLILGDGPERARLEALAAELGVSDVVIWAGKQPAVGDYLQVMSAFALPSDDHESFGNAAVEAMAVGLPTVVFADCGGVREHVRDGETGLVAADMAAFAGIVRRLHDDPAHGREVGARGRDFVRSTYTPARAAERYKALYREALASK
jgi:glycosyltransferase involved in cell wall biosynthesis